MIYNFNYYLTSYIFDFNDINTQHKVNYIILLIFQLIPLITKILVYPSNNVNNIVLVIFNSDYNLSEKGPPFTSRIT